MGQGRKFDLENALDGVDWNIEHVPRELNTIADSLSKQASSGHL